ncbi:MAG TPA: 2-oxo-4-hydroxy-4-carboxy-5-ureidoimidazoline decarboxylase [Nocardioidaceae bacterium]|nr:2-oxo-4-hydroxy-4-carboxy-5-ureidoimidazoline decarboxylase [Nocardioidaceae bacterium]
MERDDGARPPGSVLGGTDPGTGPAETSAGRRGTAWEGRWGTVEQRLRECCAADTWVAAMLEGRPYASLDAALARSDQALAGLDDNALAQALAAHSRIGDPPTGGDREATRSRAEQAGARDADPELAERLARGNRDYEERFGRVFLIHASGRSAEQMYAALRERLHNDPGTERAVVRRELAGIVRGRLTALAGED